MTFMFFTNHSSNLTSIEADILIKDYLWSIWLVLCCKFSFRRHCWIQIYSQPRKCFCLLTQPLERGFTVCINIFQPVKENLVQLVENHAQLHNNLVWCYVLHSWCYLNKHCDQPFFFLFQREWCPSLAVHPCQPCSFLVECTFSAPMPSAGQ